MKLFRTYQIILGFLLTVSLFSCESETARINGYEVHGIDVSRYQGYIDWDRVAEQKIDFVFIKATEGMTFRDSQFFCNWDALKNVGIKRGAYHFFRPKTSPVAQAEQFIFMVEQESSDLPPVLDIELLDGVAPKKIVESMKVWLDLVEDAYRVKPIIYTNMNFYNDHLAGHFDEYPLWIARYNKFFTPSLSGKKTWDFWQYGNRGKVAGIDGEVDFNVFKGELDDLEKLSEPAPMIFSFFEEK